MSQQTTSPEVVYPRPYVDVSGLLDAHGKEGDWEGLVYSGLTAIQDGAAVVLHLGSLEREEVWTKRGAIRLTGELAWQEGYRPTPLGVLWERYASLRSYLRTRSEFVLSQKRKELETLRSIGMGSEADKLAGRIERLERELSELADDER